MLWVYTAIINIFTVTVRGSTLDVRFWLLQRSDSDTSVDPRAVRVKAKCSPAIQVTKIYDSPTLRKNHRPQNMGGISPRLCTDQQGKLSSGSISFEPDQLARGLVEKIIN